MLWLGRNPQSRCLLFTAGVLCIALGISMLPRLFNFRSEIRPRPASRIVGDYRAPLHLCDSPVRIPHEYLVFLHLGHTLEQHKRTVGKGADLDSAVVVFEEEGAHPLYYAATLDNASLTAVRADVGVDLVECNREGFLIG